MTNDEILKVRQDIVGLFDFMFNKVISGTAIAAKDHEIFYETVGKLSLKFAQLAETIALEKCKALNDATKKAFTLMEEDIEKRFRELNDK